MSRVRHPGPSPTAGILLFASVPVLVGAWLLLTAARAGKLRRFNFLAGIGAIVIVSCAIYSADIDIKENTTRRHCVSNLHSLALAMSMYREDHGTLPQAKSWVNALLPYGVEREILRGRPDTQTGYSDFAMNRNLSGKKTRDIQDLHHTVMLYETSRPGKNPSGMGLDIFWHSFHSSGGMQVTYLILADGRFQALVVGATNPQSQTKGIHW